MWSRVASRDLTPLYVKLETLINEREERMKGLAVVDGECRLLIVRYANRLHATSASASAYERVDGQLLFYCFLPRRGY